MWVLTFNEQSPICVCNSLADVIDVKNSLGDEDDEIFSHEVELIGSEGISLVDVLYLCIVVEPDGRVSKQTEIIEGLWPWEKVGPFNDEFPIDSDTWHFQNIHDDNLNSSSVSAWGRDFVNVREMFAEMTSKLKIKD